MNQTVDLVYVFMCRCVCFLQATQQMEVKAFSMTNSLWPTWTRSEHLVLTYTHALIENRPYSWIIINGIKSLPGAVLLKEYLLPSNSYGRDKQELVVKSCDEG